MMQTIMHGLAGIFFAVLLLGICWVWFLGPIFRMLLVSSKGFINSLAKTYSLGTSIGNKLVVVNKETVVETDGVVTESAKLFDAISVPNYQLAKWVKSHPVKKLGYILFRGYEKHLERCLVIEGNTSLQKKHGRRIQLSNLEGVFSLDDLAFIDTTVEEVNKLVEESVSKIESKTIAQKAVAQVKEPAIEPSPVQTVTPVVEEPTPVQTAIPPAVKKDKALEAYKGYLISYGKAARHMSKSKDDATGDESGKEIEQFRVVIRSEEGVEESIWGADLLRAIKDAQVGINDMVEVIKTGKRQFGTTWKNLYAITKLA